ncbi:TetR/AcrR family transcriptional regulator [Ketobacter alkanivorans]|uniref:HTH tetR-type domain-containing protein n=1 Tax=Ketobacter alkanivorans TaxID=1917421 RepID=A0A2K9LM35_9GAMM|nr:TetR/AcrR family transcriptional regulator [Ketobacter alkanivorans]AUM13231.1 hypothetical protein Kalk_12700 [Ketobacter alkanivorans]MCP5017577.1 TetR/AcrR family transcriptional regulator [Ketobacter sp.]
MKRTRRTQQQRRDETSQAVLESATHLFGARGYQGASLEEIAHASGTTIRPIYHYFGNKQNLFLVVTEQMEERLFMALLEVDKAHDGTIAVVDYWNTFMAFAREPDFRQIVLVDAPTVLGRERWESSPVVARAIELLSSMLPHIQAETRLLIARMAVAALIEAAMSMAEPGNTRKEQAFDDVSAMIKTALQSITVVK